MKRKQLLALFFSVLIPYTIGGLLMPLLPVYLSRLGIDATISGFYLAIAFLGLAFGSISGGWISDRFQKRKWTIFLCALIQMPVIYLMGQVSHIIPLTILTIAAWYLGGVVVANVNILAGMYADPSERGQVFGILGMGLSIGGIIGGFASGAIVDRWGFPMLFTITSVLGVIEMTASYQLEDRVVKVKRVIDTSIPQIPMMTAALWFLFIAGIMANMANMGSSLGRPLAMDSLGFSATAVASANAVASILTFPVSPGLGWLSDRIGRKPVLIAAYTIAGLGALILALSSAAWHFWLATALLFFVPTSIGVGTALVTDMSDPETLGTALSRYSSTPFIGGAIGFAGGGLVISGLGITTSFIAAALCAFIAVGLIAMIAQQRKVKLAFAEGD